MYKNIFLKYVYLGVVYFIIWFNVQILNCNNSLTLCQNFVSIKAHFKAMYFVWVFTVYTIIIINGVRSNEDLKQFIAMAKRVDRGYYSGPFQLESFDTLNKCKQELFRELWCSYAVIATIHMQLTKTLLLDFSYQHRLTAEERTSVLFTLEANKILSVMYNDHHRQEDDSRNAIGEVMWIFLMYAELVQHLFSIDISRPEETNKTVLKTHEVVVNMLEEFIKSHCCKVFDPVTNQSSNIKIIIHTDTNLKRLIKVVCQNKELVNRQLEHNRMIDVRFDWAQSHFTGEHMLLSRLLDHSNSDRIKDIEKFGVQLDLIAIGKTLSHYYRMGTNVCNHLHARIRWIILFQKHFLTFMKAVAIRTVVGYLSNMKRMDDAKLKRFVADTNNNDLCKYYNTEMVEQLNSFAEYLHLTDDHRLGLAIGVLSSPSSHFSDGIFIDLYVSQLSASLKEISSEEMPFDQPMQVVDQVNSNGRTMEDVGSIISKYGLPRPADENTEFNTIAYRINGSPCAMDKKLCVLAEKNGRYTGALITV
ncbi:uncharacterized protein LOC126847004 isoform X2 [Adelges cooleyi]|uniref:uncharacterized protein LOC126847004 isoform X2 n=1 Tax=Adelges cooleyi TaxID=133065 RepID=UPI00217F4BBF|nr:uncharacterized protein LOC126847004 isoform X2 [Adelges cooleyi]